MMGVTILRLALRRADALTRNYERMAMAVELSEYTDSLRRAITPLGSDKYADISDAVLTDYLTDAFWQGRLDGFYVGYTADEDGTVEPIEPGDPEFDRAWVSLVILYAAVSILANQILATSTRFSAKAGPVEFEQENSASVLNEMLKQLAAAKQRIIDQMLDNSNPSNVYLIDAYSTRMLSSASYYGSSELLG